MLTGGDGNDTLRGDAGNDTLEGGLGMTCRGRGGHDLLQGDEGEDSLFGGEATISFNGGDEEGTCSTAATGTTRFSGKAGGRRLEGGRGRRQG